MKYEREMKDVNIQAASKPHKFTEVRFASFFSGGFITAIVVNLPERKLAKRTSVQCGGLSLRCHRATVYQEFKIRRRTSA